MQLRPCPSCHRMLRGVATTCYHCGFDFAHPEVAPREVVEPQPDAPPEPLDPENLGPCPAGILTRFLDPRLSDVELERSVRGYGLVPFLESYYRLGALLLGEMFISGLGWWRAPIDDPAEASWFLGGTYYRYSGAPGPLILGLVGWFVVLVLFAVELAASPRGPHALAFVPLALLYVVIIVLSKSIRVATARQDYVRRMSAGHLGEV